MNMVKQVILSTLLSLLLVSPIQSSLVVNAHNNFISFADPNPGSKSGALVVLHCIWGGISIPGSPASSVDNVFNINLEPEITRPALFYPSPFRLKEGTTLGYQLNQGLSMQIRIYDMRGYEIFRRNFDANTEQGGFQGYNYIKFNKDGGHSLPENMPAGVYFYVLINDGKVLGKGKFAILP